MLVPVLLFLLLILCLSATVAGLFRPRLIVRWRENPTRSQAAAAGILASVAVLAGWIASLPAVSPSDPSPPVQIAAPSVSAPVSAPVLARKWPPELTEKVISLGADGLVQSIRAQAPRLEKIRSEKKAEGIVIDIYGNSPSGVTLTLETLPGQGLTPGAGAVIRATMIRPLADRPSPFDGGLAKTLAAFVTSAAPDWPAAAQNDYIGDCLTNLETNGCDRTVNGIRVQAKRYGADQFRIEAGR